MSALTQEKQLTWNDAQGETVLQIDIGKKVEFYIPGQFFNLAEAQRLYAAMGEALKVAEQQA